MAEKEKHKQFALFVRETTAEYGKPARKKASKKMNGCEPPNLGKAIRLPVPDFSDPGRPPVCLEVDFPITPINALSNLEGNAGKPIYQMSKWWARRRSSVFRSLLIAAATEAPSDPTQAAKLVWDHYYCNHQKAGHFRKLRVLDIFMGGGTTLVEGARLGFRMTGIDLNPVAWFVTKNELACSDPEQVKALFADIEASVKPLVQPFYITTCPRGHKGKWFRRGEGQEDRRAGGQEGRRAERQKERRGGQEDRRGEGQEGRRGGGQEDRRGEGQWERMPERFDPLELPPEERHRYRWEGPEIIYTFWAKHGPCQARDCGHRTPIFRSPLIAEKKLTAYYIPAICPSCGHSFNIELGETRMAPGAERVILDNEPGFTETSQEFAQLIKDYSKGDKEEKQERIDQALGMVDAEAGLCCPKCGSFAGGKIKRVLEEHRGRRLQMGNLVDYEFKVGNVKKNDFGIESRYVYMYLLIHPKWLEGASGIEGQENGRTEGQEDRRIEGQKETETSFASCAPAPWSSQELGGYAGADPEKTAQWFNRRLEGLRFIEVRGRIRLADEEIAEGDEEVVGEGVESGKEGDIEDAADRKKYGLPGEIMLADGTRINTRIGTVPQKSHFTCQKCGKMQDILEAVKPTNHTAPVAAYALQCHCPECEAEGYNYNGRYFKVVEMSDVERLIFAEREWAERKDADLNNYWPRSEILPAYMTHKLNGGIPNWGYTHWWKMFNPRQLLVHAQLLQTITEAPESQWPLDVREQALGAVQQYLRNQNMFVFWNPQRDTPEPMFSNANFHPKQQVIENCTFHLLGRGNWQSSSVKVIEAMEWAIEPWELVVVSEDGVKKKSEKAIPQDPVNSGANIYCCSSTDLSMLVQNVEVRRIEGQNAELLFSNHSASYPTNFCSPVFDLVITDPPFGDNLFYADLADFFYVWMRLPLLKWYQGMPERKYFEPERTPHAIEAVDNSVEHPEDREEYEKERFATSRILSRVRELTGNKKLCEKDPNPLYRPEPSSEFYQKTLTACWAEAGRLLKPGGLMAFTFHHSQDDTWVSVLTSLFNAGFVLTATYPIRSDERKGERAQFGSQSIEYDIIHVCRKRIEEPQPVSWARMRRWVKEEAAQLKELLEHSHGKELPESDLLVILRGKALEFYSRHYGQVYTGDGQVLGVRDALLGINQLLEDLLAGNIENGKLRPPEEAEPASRLFLRIFQGRQSMARDELHKTLRGTGISQGDLEARGWIRVTGTAVNVIPISERFQFFTAPGRNRKALKTDFDQAHFLIGAAKPGSGIDVSDELNRTTFQIKKSVEPILDWYAKTDPDLDIRRAAMLSLDLVRHWRAKPKEGPTIRQLSLFAVLDEE